MQKRRVTSEDIWSLKYVSDPRISPDGKKVAYTLSKTKVDSNGYESSIWLVDEEGCSRQLTYYKKEEGLVKDHAPRWSPDQSKLAFVSNRNGKNQIFILPLDDSGEAYQLTNHQAGVSNPVWSPDGKHIAFVAKPPQEQTDAGNSDVMVFKKLRYKFNGVGYITDDRPKHIWTVNVETGVIEQATNSPFDDQSPAWSPDSKSIAFASCRIEDEKVLWTDIWVKDLDGKARKLTDNIGPAAEPAWSPDGKYVAFVGHDKGTKHSANRNIWVVPSQGGEAKNISADYDRSVGSTPGSDARYGGGNNTPAWKHDSSGLYFTVADHGASKLCFVALDGSVCEITNEKHAIAAYDILSTEQEEKVAYAGETPAHPCDVFMFTNDEHSRLTEVNKEALAEWAMTYPENYTFTSKEDWEVEGWIMKPVGIQEGEKYPVVVQIHGGPHVAYGWSFYHEFHMLCSQGYGIVYTNPRGSRSYGEAFTHGVIADWGGGDYADIMAAVEYVTKNYDWVDADRIGVTGGSYGGYLTNWIVGQTDRFKAAVTLRSISSLYTKYGVSDIGWYGNRAGMGGADLWDSEDFIMERSPIRYAPNVKTPILIIHSLEDYRCPFEQGEQFYVALKRLGNAPVEMVVFKGENHELSRSGKPRNRVERLERISDWFERYL